MTSIIAFTANTITVVNARRTAVVAMRVVVLVVPNNVPTVKIMSVQIACRNALSVTHYIAVHVLKKIFVQTVKKK